ncbi:hypothetical protein FQN60_007799, partial [Etheostoma spectabile]
ITVQCGRVLAPPPFFFFFFYFAPPVLSTCAPFASSHCCRVMQSSARLCPWSPRPSSGSGSDFRTRPEMDLYHCAFLWRALMFVWEIPCFYTLAIFLQLCPEGQQGVEIFDGQEASKYFKILYAPPTPSQNNRHI